MSIRFLFFAIILLCIAVLLLSPIVKTGLEKYAMYTIGIFFIFGLALTLLAVVRIILKQKLGLFEGARKQK